MVKSDSKIIIFQHFPKLSLTGLPGSKKLKMQNLAISSFKGLKFAQICPKQAKKWPNHLISGKQFQKKVKWQP